MNNSTESGVTTPKLFLTENAAYFKSPTHLFSDQGIETPHKIPVAPHPSPVNMEIESSNPKSKEVFRTELLQACQLKIPDAIAKASRLDDDVPANLSCMEEEPISDLSNLEIEPICPDHNKEKMHIIFDHFPGDEKLNPLERFQAGRDFEQFSKVFNGKDGQSGNLIPDEIPKFKVYSSDFDHGSKCTEEMVDECSRITYSTENIFEGSNDDCSISPIFPVFRNQFDASPKFKEDYLSDINQCNRVGENQVPRITYSNGNVLEFPTGGKSDKSPFEPRPPTLNLNLLDSMHRKDGASVFYDHATDHLEISKLLEVNSGLQETSICRSRSPCSDKMSTIAVCSSDTSDISDGDFVDRDRSMDFDEKDSDGSGGRRPAKKQASKSSAMRRFLSWRRSLKFRKRTASLDESKFPVFVNRFDSYKTEFELSV